MNRNLFYFFTLILSLNSCSEDLVSNVEDSSEPLNAYYYHVDYAKNNSESFIIEDPTIENKFTTEDGVILTFYPNSFLNDGQAYNGKVNLSFCGVFNQTDMILSNLPTVGHSNTQGLSLLQSGGEFLVRAMSEEEEALTASQQYLVKIPNDLMDESAPEMQMFTLGEFVWRLQLEATEIENFSNYYNILVDDFNWINCDKFLNFDGDLVDIEYVFPEGYTSYNSVFFNVLDKYPYSIASSYLNLPIGETGTVVFLSKTENFYYVGSAELKVEENLKIDFSEVELYQVSPDKIRKYISNLLK